MMLFCEFADRWEDTILTMKKPSTRKTMAGHIRVFKMSFGNVPVQSLSHRTIQDLFSRLSVRLQPRSVKNLHTTLHVLLKQARREGLIGEIPEIVLPRITRSPQDKLSAEQMRRLIAASDARKGLFYSILAETGMRIGEVLGLQFRDIDRLIPCLSVQRSVYNGVVQTPKTDNSLRNVCISEHLLKLLDDNGSGGSGDFLFRTINDRPWDASDATKALKRDLNAVGIGDVSGFHAFRRGNVEVCIKTLGIPEPIVGARIGHRSRGMTLGVYVQRDEYEDLPWVGRIAEAIFGVAC